MSDRSKAIRLMVYSDCCLQAIMIDLRIRPGLLDAKCTILQVFNIQCHRTTH